MASLFARVLGLLPASLMMEPELEPEPPKPEEPEVKDPEDPKENWSELKIYPF